MELSKTLASVALSISLAAVSVVPATSAPFGAPSTPVLSAPITLAASRNEWNGRRDGGSYKGYKGSREYRPGHRRDNDGWWYPLAAFGLGAAIGGAVTQPRYVAPARSGNAHTNWCHARYRSYQAWNNTFQPYNGPRQPCYSPYG